jgi:hypothetical protein
MTDHQFADLNLDEMPHQPGDIDLLLRIYDEKRLKSQSAFYESRILENQRNSDFTFNLATGIMTLSSLLATISASITPSRRCWSPSGSFTDGTGRF